MATAPEIEALRQHELVLGSVRAQLRAIAMLAHNSSGPFAHWAAHAVPQLAAIMTVVDPGWRRRPEWATAVAAEEFYAQFAEEATELQDALQATAQPAAAASAARP